MKHKLKQKHYEDVFFYSLVIPTLTSLPTSSSLLFPPPSAPSFVWLLILTKRTDQIFLLECTRLSVGALQIWWLGLTDGRRPWVLKFVTDSSGFDSPRRSSRAGSLKTPGARRGEEEEVRGMMGKWERVGNKSICGVVRAAGGSRSSRGFLKFTHGPPLHSFSSFLPSTSSFLESRLILLLVFLSYPLVIAEVCAREAQFICSASIPWGLPKAMLLQSLTIIKLI